MTPDELAAAAAQLREEYEHETKELQEQVERARAKVARLETRLGIVRDQYQQRWGRLSSSFLGLPAPEPAPAPNAPQANPTAESSKRRRGTLNEPVLALVRELYPPGVSSGRAMTAWNQRHPENTVRDSTVRSILERLEAQGLLAVENEGCGKGSGIPRTYKPA